ncbi:MAG: hypothetical protein N3E37_01540 [Candidatus Micrarchaeota archaeon]|nr:hypothetical protein [Candidatus Micrarchaeota archaeon]
MVRKYSPMGMAGIMGITPELSASSIKLDPKKVLIFITVSVVVIKIVSTVLALTSGRA